MPQDGLATGVERKGVAPVCSTDLDFICSWRDQSQWQRLFPPILPLPFHPLKTADSAFGPLLLLPDVYHLALFLTHDARAELLLLNRDAGCPAGESPAWNPQAHPPQIKCDMIVLGAAQKLQFEALGKCPCLGDPAQSGKGCIRDCEFLPVEQRPPDGRDDSLLGECGLARSGSGIVVALVEVAYRSGTRRYDGARCDGFNAEARAQGWCRSERPRPN